MIFFCPFAFWGNNENLKYPTFHEQYKGTRILTYKELQTLKKNIEPQFIYYYDWEEYQKNKKILVKGILFTYRNLLAKKVFIAGNFSEWKFREMKRSLYGVFYYIHQLENNNEKNQKNYYYKFFVDGIWTIDPINQNKKIVNYNEVSVYEFEDSMNYHLTKTEVLNKQYSQNLLSEDFFSVEFKIHESHLKRVTNKENIFSVSIVSNFNFWNPYANFLEKDKKGIYRWKTNLPKGIYYYNYVVDGIWILDPLNENSKFLPDFGRMFSYIEVK